jgi:hypothetical protein
VRIKPIMVLLVGETARSSLKLLNWLNSRGCLCQLAQSYREACNLVSCTQFLVPVPAAGPNSLSAGGPGL